MKKYNPKSKEELRVLLENIPIDEWKNIDTSKITDMSNLFHDWKSDFGDISKWDVSNVTDMSCMFAKSEFNSNISNWNVSNVKYMMCMFSKSAFKGDISNWNVDKKILVESNY